MLVLSCCMLVKIRLFSFFFFFFVGGNMKSKIYGWVGVIEVEFFMGKNVFMHKFPECDGALQW